MLQGLNQSRAICRRGTCVETIGMHGPTKRCLWGCRAGEQLLREDQQGLKEDTASHQALDAEEVALRHSIE